jgi:hypothetical protein
MMMIRRTWIALVSFVLLGSTGLCSTASVAGWLRALELPATGRRTSGGPIRLSARTPSSRPHAVLLVDDLERLSKVEKDMQELARRQGGAAR